MYLKELVATDPGPSLHIVIMGSSISSGTTITTPIRCP
jgi:hypothetical protein